jgi:hypothetical protein
VSGPYVEQPPTPPLRTGRLSPGSRQSRLEPARRALAAALSVIARDHDLSRGDEIELLTQELGEHVARWRKGRR